MGLLHSYPFVTLILLPVVVATLAWIYWGVPLRRKHSEITTTAQSNQDGKVAGTVPEATIGALTDFDWRTTEPLQLRPFKPKYHLTMALENTSMSELVLMDKTYLDRINLRRRLIRDQGDAVVAANEVIRPAVNEFYEWILGTYLPTRFPTMFKIDPAPSQSSATCRSQLENLVTGDTIPIAPPSDPVQALRIIGSHVDTDFLFLLPSASPADAGKYKLEGYITCFPSGFDTRLKLNRKLADIHQPVPGYAAKIEKSMDRFFANLPVGRIVKRANWSVTTNTLLFTLGGNHLYEGEVARQEEVDVEQTVVRCERQTLHRLPGSGAVVFAFKTYQYPLAQIKAEGSGEALAQAIAGLGLGNVPEMAVYKRGVVWGDAVTAYLRS